MTPAEIVRKAIPTADDGLVDHIVWGRTPFPVGITTAKMIYKAAMRWDRADKHHINLCDLCDNKVAAPYGLCSRCAAALHKVRELRQ